MPRVLGDILAAQARATPNAVAIDFGAGHLTYAQLDQFVEHLAAVLAGKGVRRHDRVALYLTKVWQSYAAVLAILRLGGVYVPVDASAPFARASRILSDCVARAIIVDGPRVEAVLSSDLCEMLCAVVVVDDTRRDLASDARVVSWTDATANNDVAPAVRTIEDDLAAILYTSGSTGQPKGVMLSHRNMLAFIEWAVGEIALSSRDRVAGIAELHFDLSVFDLFATLYSGGTLVPLPSSGLLRPTAVAAWLQDERIAIIYTTPSSLVLLLERGDFSKRSYPALRSVLFAGEVFPIKLLRLLRRLLPDAGLFNLYGPTETNVCAWARVDVVPADDATEIPIGRACTNVEIAAIDDNGNEVPAGTEGELCVRGATVMQGYWGDPERTSSVLTRWPSSPCPHATWYRTGDLVHADASGVFYFHGRRDNMVKVRGYRVELGEVEAALYAHDDVRQVAVVAETLVDAAIRLHAFVVADMEPFSELALRKHLAERLPSYMIPSKWTRAAALPMTSSGKIDRRKLVTTPAPPV